MVRPKLWDVDDEWWAAIEPLLPKVECRARHPGAAASGPTGVQGIVFVLCTGLSLEHLPQELGFGSGMTCWYRPAEWTEAGVWHRLHEVLLGCTRFSSPSSAPRTPWTSPGRRSTAPTSGPEKRLQDVEPQDPILQVSMIKGGRRIVRFAAEWT